MKFYATFPVEHFKNVKIKGFIAATRNEFDFALVDLPFMNPNDLISLFLIQSKD